MREGTLSAVCFMRARGKLSGSNRSALLTIISLLPIPGRKEPEATPGASGLGQTKAFKRRSLGAIFRGGRLQILPPHAASKSQDVYLIPKATEVLPGGCLRLSDPKHFCSNGRLHFT